MTDYLEQVAVFLSRRAAAVEARARDITPLREQGQDARADALEREVRAERAAITRDYIALAAVEKGMQPCRCHEPPGPGAAAPGDPQEQT